MTAQCLVCDDEQRRQIKEDEGEECLLWAKSRRIVAGKRRREHLRARSASSSEKGIRAILTYETEMWPTMFGKPQK